MILRLHLLLVLQWPALALANYNRTSGLVNHVTTITFRGNATVDDASRQLFYDGLSDQCSENLCGYYIGSDGNVEEMVSNCVYDSRGDRYRSRCTRITFLQRIRRWERLESCGCCSAQLTTRTSPYCNYPSNPPCGGDSDCRIPRSRFANSQVCYRDAHTGQLESRCVNAFENFLVNPNDSYTCGACPSGRVENPTPSAPLPSDDVTDCGCPQTCTENVLETMASDGVSSISCRTRIKFLMTNFEMSQQDACTLIGDRFPDTCGQGCHPLTCSSSGPPPPPPRPSPPTAPTSSITDCGCPNSCTIEVLESLATDGIASIECQTRMIFAMNRFSLTPLDACAMVATRYADACGACDPRTCNSGGSPPGPAPVPVLSPPNSIQAGDLVFAEEFNSGDRPDPAIWTYDYGDWGWGNAELQRYTDNLENVQITNGKLVITAIRQGNQVTSGRIKTLNKFTFKYGRVEASIKVPDLRNGLWPAFWTLGNNFPVIGWPKCGEIDIMEMGNEAPGNSILNQRVGSAAHWFHDPDGRATYGLYLDAGQDLTQGFHTFSMEWTPSMITTFVDGRQIWAMNISPQECPTTKCSEFHDFHFFLLNLAVGGTYTGNLLNINQITAPFPARYEIDYVRLYANQWTEIGGTSVNGNNPTPRFGLTSCGCPTTCTAQVLDRIAIDSYGSHSCRNRIEWVIDNVLLTEQQACQRVSFEFPSICGQGCNPSTCY